MVTDCDTHPMPQQYAFQNISATETEFEAYHYDNESGLSPVFSVKTSQVHVQTMFTAINISIILLSKKTL